MIEGNKRKNHLVPSVHRVLFIKVIQKLNFVKYKQIQSIKFCVLVSFSLLIAQT